MAEPRRIYRNPSPETHDIVRSKEGDYLRRKRGTIKPAEINDHLKRNCKETGSTAAKRIMLRLATYREHMYGRIQVFLSARLRKGWQIKEETDYRYCVGWEVMQNHPLTPLYCGHWQIRNDGIALKIELDHVPPADKYWSTRATDYFVEAILLHGDAMLDNNLRVESERSEPFKLNENDSHRHSFSFILPAERKYLLFLKVGLLESGKPATHGKYFGMRVIAAG